MTSRTKTSWLFAVTLAGALLLPSLACAGPRHRVVVHHRVPKPIVAVKVVPARPVPVKKVWISGHWKRLPSGRRIWVAGHWKYYR